MIYELRLILRPTKQIKNYHIIINPKYVYLHLLLGVNMETPPPALTAVSHRSVQRAMWSYKPNNDLTFVGGRNDICHILKNITQMSQRILSHFSDPMCGLNPLIFNTFYDKIILNIWTFLSLEFKILICSYFTWNSICLWATK